MPLTLALYPLRFHFRSLDSLLFPEGKSGNIVRGAFGENFRRLVCLSDCQSARTCEHRLKCPYARVFEPVHVGGPSGMADPPRPFVFRAAHLDGRRFAPGERFHFDVNLFDVQQPAIPYFVASFAQLARAGFGPRRGRAVLETVTCVNPPPERIVFDGAGQSLYEPIEPFTVGLCAGAAAVGRVQIEFQTPTEIKGGGHAESRPEFATLFARVRDRISALRSLYGEGPLEIDFRALGERAAAVRLVRCNLRRIPAVRKSGRTGQVHPLGGFVGMVEYEGDLGEFVPYLMAAEWTGVGRQTVWGKGAIRVYV